MGVGDKVSPVLSAGGCRGRPPFPRCRQNSRPRTTAALRPYRCARLRKSLIILAVQCLYWIVASDPTAYPIPPDEPYNLDDGFGPPPPDPAFQPLGHVALDREDYLDPPIKELASRETGSILLASLFVLKSQQGRGLGNKVMTLCEDEARRLGAPQITLDT